MNTLLIKTRKISFLVIVALTIIALSSCGKDDLIMGYTKLIEWFPTDYSQIDDNGTMRYIVSSDGGTFQFNSKTYDRLSIGRISFESDGEQWSAEDDKTITIHNSSHFKNDICEVIADDKIVEITFNPNASHMRKVDIKVYSADAYSIFSFTQQASQK